MQPAFDYLIGRKIYDVIKTGNNIDIEYTNGIYQMLSLIAIEEDEKLISEYSNIKLEESVLFDLICYTLANTSAGIASKYRDYVKQLMQYSEAEFTYLRLEHAKQLLQNSDIPVTEVAMLSGYQNVSYFIRSFKKTYGVSPLKYRKNEPSTWI